MNTGWDGLKDAIKFYLVLTGGPSVPLCESLLKLPDFIDAVKSGQDPGAEMDLLALHLTVSLACGVQLRLEQLGGAPDVVKRLEHSKDWCAANANPILARQILLVDVNLALQALKQATGMDYPQLPI